MMLMKKILILVVVLSIGTFLGGSSSWAKDPYKIGFTGPLTGPAAYMGDVNKKTVLMIAEQINAAGGIDGHPIEIIVYDSENKPDTTVQVFNRLIKKDEVLVIVGPTTSIEAMAALPIAEQTKTPTVMPVGTSEVVKPIRKYVFKTPISEADAVAKDLDYLKEKNLTRIAVVTSQDGYGEAGREAIEKLAPAKGIEIILKEKVSFEDKDMTPIVFKVKRSGAQALLEWTHLRPSVILTRNIKQVGLDIPVICSFGAVQDAWVKAVGVEAAEGKIGATYKFMDAESLPDNDPQKPVILKYQKTFFEKYGENPIQFGANAYDAMHIIIMALKKAGPDKEKIRNAIEETKNYIGTGAIFNFSPTSHDPSGEKSMVMYKVVKGKWILLK